MKNFKSIKYNLKVVYKTLIFIFFIGIVAFVYRYQKMPQISVVMPVYNRSQLVRRAIESILQQTFTDFEFIIIDDGSSDGTIDILKYYQKLDSRIKIFYNNKNMGVGYSRQLGVEKSTGKYIAIMDSDDWAMPNRLKKSISVLRKHPDIDFLKGGFAPLNKRRNFDLIKEDMSNDVHLIPNDSFDEINLMFYNTFGAHPANLIKKEFLIKHQIRYNHSYKAAEDYDLWAQLLLNKAKYLAVSDVFTLIRYHHTNSSSYYNIMKQNSILTHEKIFKSFFLPIKSELKYKYRLDEECSILKKIKLINTQKNIFKQDDLVKIYNQKCPFNFQDLPLLIYDSHYSIFLVSDQKDWKVNHSIKRCFLHFISDNLLMVEWKNSKKKEYFKKIENNVWTLISSANL